MNTQEGRFIITEPCHEDWNKMTKVEQGKFCDVCSKCVFDLTKKNQEEIATLYKENENNLCGHMQLSQIIGKPSPDKERVTERTPLNKLQMFAVALLTAFSMLFGSQAKAQNTQHLRGAVVRVVENSTLDGKVTWEHGGAVKNVKVELSRNGYMAYETTTDEKGRYSFPKIASGTYTLKVYDYGFVAHESSIAVEYEKKVKRDVVLEDIQIDGGIGMFEEPVIEEPLLVDPEGQEAEADVVEINQEGGAQKLTYMTEDIMINDDTLVMERDVIEIEYTQDMPDEVLDGTQEELRLAGNTMTIFPNPTRDVLNIHVDWVDAEEMELYLTDLGGKVLLWQKLSKDQPRSLSVNMIYYPAGTYLLKVVSGKESLEKRVVLLK